MNGGETTRAPRPKAGGTGAFAAVDLGTNNCRLLIAAPGAGGRMRVLGSYSRIVRLGEGLNASGVLGPEAMDRALEALTTCTERIGEAGVGQVRAVATQACRAARNGEAFARRVRDLTGLPLEIIDAAEEAGLSVAGCQDLIDRDHDAALIVDVGGGSTELSWLDLRSRGAPPRTAGWRSLPLGVVDLAERFPEAPGQAAGAWEAMLGRARYVLAAVGDPGGLRDVFEAGRGQVIGVSGAVTSLAALQLDLPRYRRDRVDGAWIATEDCAAVTRRLLSMSVEERGRQPCIGPDRGDLVLAGAAILRAVLERWPARRVRVGDRGLREGMLLRMMAEAEQPASAFRPTEAAA